MNQILTSLTRWWAVPLLTGVLLFFAGVYGFLLSQTWIFYVCMVLSFFVLVWQLVMTYVAMIQREWWCALFSFIGMLVTGAFLFGSLLFIILVDEPTA